MHATATAHRPEPAHADRRPFLRFAGFAGLATLAGILAFDVVAPMTIAGQRVTQTLDASAIRAYHAHDALALGAIVAGALAAGHGPHAAAVAGELRVA